MNRIQSFINKVDAFQQRVPVFAFMYAVIKKYGDDRVGYQAALLTYYSFLSLFPLLLILTTLTQLLATNNPQLQASLLHSVTGYFPVLGDQLSTHIHSLHKNGMALLVGLVVIFYGTRGVADVFRHGTQHVWHIRNMPQGNFLESAITSFKIIVGGGIGFIAASTAAGLAASAGHSPAFRILSLVINVGIIYWLFLYVLQLSLPAKTRMKELRVAAAVAASGFIICQLLGGIILFHVLKNLDALYSYFATTLGLIFWIYLQAQVVYYAEEISVVKNNSLWPRSLSGNLITPADKKLLAEKHRFTEPDTDYSNK